MRRAGRYCRGAPGRMAHRGLLGALVDDLCGRKDSSQPVGSLRGRVRAYMLLRIVLVLAPAVRRAGDSRAVELDRDSPEVLDNRLVLCRDVRVVRQGDLCKAVGTDGGGRDTLSGKRGGVSVVAVDGEGAGPAKGSTVSLQTPSREKVCLRTRRHRAEGRQRSRSTNTPPS